ncbi:glycoside hydrolase family 99-like domain-containing protein [Angustibacter speluncae]
MDHVKATDLLRRLPRPRLRRYTVAGARRRLSRAAAELGFRRPWGDGDGPQGPELSSWAERLGGRRAAGFPEEWRTHDELPFPDPARVAVLVHVYYAHLLPEIVEHLAHVPVPFDLVVTNASGEQVELDTSAVPHVRHQVVLDVANHGRDILPLVKVVNAGLLDPYELVLKVHTKESVWRADHELGGSGEQWRAELLGSLLGSEEQVRELLGAFHTDPDLGVVTADGSVLGPEYWGDNQGTTRALLRRIELSLVEDDLRFAAGSMYWVRGFVLTGLRSLNLSEHDFEAEAGQVNATAAHAVERIVGVVAREAGLSVRERGEVTGDGTGWEHWDAGTEREPRARVVPFYLPQFHPFAENDRWWGRGFTEWTNVSAARPAYLGHHQPKIPLDVGFYDLRVDAVREQQARMADAVGIGGFMYYYYCFAGRRLMNLPIEQLLAGDVDFPFCVMWANENWTRRWDGRTTDVLIGQDHDHVPAADFVDDVMEFLRDERYLRVDGRPVVAVYRVGQIPDFPQVAAEWRRRAREAGVGELYLLNVDVASEFDGMSGSPAQNNLDGSLGFPPHNLLWEWLPHAGLHVDQRFSGNLLSYGAMVRDAEDRLTRNRPDHHPGVMVTFDNTARRQWSSDVWFGSNPYTFRRWLRAAVRAVEDRDPQQRLVFVNAWNEWAEGAVLEPSDRFGPTYLHAVRDVLLG